MGCYREVYRARVGTWAAGTGWRVQSGNKDSKLKSFLVNTCLCAVVLAVLLVIGNEMGWACGSYGGGEGGV
jgi:hypothetical protein